MTFDSLCDFIRTKMRMSHIYQPLLIKSLVECDGMATLRQLAHSFLSQDESQLLYYEDRIGVMPVPVLKRHGVIAKEGALVRLNVDGMSFRQKEAPAKAAECVFCADEMESRIIERNGTVFAIEDRYPVTKGHCLVIPYRHVPDFFQLTESERRDSDDLVRYLKNRVQADDGTVVGFNLGYNCGEAAGQTVMHSHLHLIPRRRGDIERPEGGVRGAVPGKMRYRP